MAMMTLVVMSLMSGCDSHYEGENVTPIDAILDSQKSTFSYDGIYYIGEEEICENRVLYLMNSVGMEYPHIVYAQMRLESGNFTSGLARECNNFFGMKHPRNRESTSLGASEKGYATYENWAMSVYDYALWQRLYAKGLTEEEYLDMLSRNYAEDEEYVIKVKRIAELVRL